MSSVEATILKSLSLSSTTASQLSRHGSSGLTSTYKMTANDRTYFIKASASADAATMFQGEHASLNAIHNAVPSLCPKSLSWGKLDNGAGYFLCTEFIDMNARSNYSKTSDSLAIKLAILHTTPIPEEHRRKGFGFPVSTCCGGTVQDNNFKSSWADFFAQNRLMKILEQAEASNGKDKKLRSIIEKVVEKVVPKLLADGHLGGEEGIQPVVCHGDLWSGNKGRGTFGSRDGGDEGVEEIVFDPSVTYGHNEYDHGMMNMFGGFSGAFWNEYFNHLPKTVPMTEYKDRVALYESYHHLNHYAMFGGGYKSGAVRLLEPLIRKYG